jgi:hypothetical protein
MGGNMMRGNYDSDTHPQRRFREYLAQLKQQGSGLLVTGEASETARMEASQKLFGTADPDEPRRRVLISTDPGVVPEEYLPDGVHPSDDDDDVRVVETAGYVRGTTATATTASPHTSILDQLEADTETALQELIRTDSPDPGVLRVGVTSLQPLIETAGLSRVEEFVTILAAKVRQWNGMLHVHYPVPDTEESVLTFRRHMDARIELRDRPDRAVEWHWHTADPLIDAHLLWVEI